jgi:hypothetical protein
MKYLDKKTIAKYLYDQLTGNFAGFLIGMSATGLVSQFFETRSLKNLWGLGAKKTVINKETFSNLEWVISIIIGFIAFEIMTKVVKEKIDKYFPVYRLRLFRWLVRNNFHARIKEYQKFFSNQRVIFFASMHSALKSTFSKFSQR